MSSCTTEAIFVRAASAFSINCPFEGFFDQIPRPKKPAKNIDSLPLGKHQPPRAESIGGQSSPQSLAHPFLLSTNPLVEARSVDSPLENPGTRELGLK
jgi:hypothetical protein